MGERSEKRVNHEITTLQKTALMHASAHLAEDIEDLMGELDTDGDGVVVFAEFEPWWRENGGKTYAGRSRERDRTGGNSPRRKGLKGAA